jgi:hypothetical protein
MAIGIFTLRQQLRGLLSKNWTGTIKTPYVEYLVVGGGGGGGSEGGGGAGGLLTGLLPVTTGTSYTVTVGGGGAAATSGSNSVLGSVTANGGGSARNNLTGLSGGSGGGGATSSPILGGGGQGIAGQGNSGGGGRNNDGVNAAGGGGGAGTIGLSPQTGNIGGNGGAGIASAISGTVTPYAGGGGGSSSGGTYGSGGVGGGGAAGPANGGTAGTANTGGGGGGTWGATAAAGGSGIVIVSYPDIYAPLTTGGATSPTVSTSGSGSMYFTGTANQYMSATSSNLSLGTGDFTIEMWAYLNTLSALTIWFSGGNNVYIGWNPTTYYLYYSNATGSAFQLSSASTSALVANTWTHIVVVRSGGVISLFANGTRYATASSNTQAVDCTNFVFGAYNQAPSLYNPNGYFTNVRMTNTAVYNPSSSTLTVPTAPLTAVSGTKILLSVNSGSYFADSSTSGVVLAQGNTGAAVPAWNQQSPFATGLGYKNRVYTWVNGGGAGTSATGTFTV